MSEPSIKEAAVFLLKQFEARVLAIEKRLDELEAVVTLGVLARNGTCRDEYARSLKVMVANSFDLSDGEIDQDTRRARIAFPRQVAMFVMRRRTKLSLGEIGGCFGARHYDHGTVIHAMTAVENRMQTEPEFRKKMDVLLSCISEKNHGE